MVTAEFSAARERLLLQIAVGVAGLVPVGAGLAGVVLGQRLVGDFTNVSADSHFRYLSGLLLAIGLVFWASIPRIETRAERFSILALIVFVGGCARLWGLLTVGVPGGPMLFGLAMEFAVTPAIWFWQRRISRRA